jgi:pyruvate/2-oxoglutarate dehydrogenase complex dihydrolipoamide acyltransferase (E2) component
MTTKINIPRLEMSMTEGVLAAWLVPDGAEVTEGQSIYTLETNKAVQDIAAPATGKLKQLAAPGSTFEVGVEIGEIG